MLSGRAASSLDGCRRSSNAFQDLESEDDDEHQSEYLTDEKKPAKKTVNERSSFDYEEDDNMKTSKKESRLSPKMTCIGSKVPLKDPRTLEFQTLGTFPGFGRSSSFANSAIFNTKFLPPYLIPPQGMTGLNQSEDPDDEDAEMKFYTKKMVKEKKTLENLLETNSLESFEKEVSHLSEKDFYRLDYMIVSSYDDLLITFSGFLDSGEKALSPKMRMIMKSIHFLEKKKNIMKEMIGKDKEEAEEEAEDEAEDKEEDKAEDKAEGKAEDKEKKEEDEAEDEEKDEDW